MSDEPHLPRRPSDAHKGMFGHVLCVGGDHGMGGAIVLAVEAALRTGAGKVSVATRPEHVPVLLTRRPECMPSGVESAQALGPLLARATVVALGPGLGRAAWGQALFDAVLACGKPLVIDADALNLLAAAPRPVEDAVLTPHPGEAARLLGVGTEAVQADRPAALAQLVARFGCAVVLKGSHSLVGAPANTTRTITAGNPGMASGGMGDALTGIIAALRAQGMDAFDAAWHGAAVHARAGDRARDAVGGHGLLASDLIACIPGELDRC